MNIEDVKQFCAPGKVTAKRLSLDRERLTALCKPGERDAYQFFAHRITPDGKVEGTIHGAYTDEHVTVDPSRITRD